MAINLKEYIRESLKIYLAILKTKLATKNELNALNGANLKLTGYSKATNTSAINPDDYLQIAISKLEKGLEDAGTSENDHNHSNIVVLNAITASFTTELLNKLNSVADGANNYVLPANVVIDADYNNYSSTEKSKVSNLPANANNTFATKTSVDNINAILNSDDSTLDEFQEVVNYIKANRSDLSNLNLDNIAQTASKIHFTPTMRDNLLFTAISNTEAQADWDNS